MPPSLSFYVRETCSASAESYTPAPAPQADNGLGSPKTTNSQQIAPGYTKTIVWCSGERIARKDVGGTNLEFEVTASPSASGSSGYGGGATVTYSAEIVEYAVGIRLSNDPNYKKDALNLPLENDRSVLTPRQADWGILDTDVYAPNGTQPLWLIEPTFMKQADGPWNNPLNEWDAAGQTFRDTLTQEWDLISPWWYLKASDFASLPITKTIKLKVTDNGGDGPITETGVMNFIVHNRYENWTKGQKGADIYQAHDFTSVASPGYALPPTGGVLCTWSHNPICYDDIQNIIGAMTSISGNMVSNPLLAGFLAAVGAAGNQWLPKDDSNTCSFACWGAYLSTIDGQVPASWPPASEQHNYRCYPRLYDIYDNYQYDAAQYGHTGYEGTAHSWVKHRYNGWLVGNFVHVGSGGSATGGGQ